MPTNKEISDKVDQLQAALDTEQQQVADLLAQKDQFIAEKDQTIATLNQTIADLQAQQADGGTPEERQAVIDKLVALQADLEGTAPGAEQPGDTETPEEPEIPEEEEPNP